MHRSSTSLKRHTDVVALPQRHGARATEHRTGLPYVPSTPSTRSSSSSRSSSELLLSQPSSSWEHRPQLSGVTGRQTIVPPPHRSQPQHSRRRNASSPMRQASPPQYPKGGAASKPISHATKEAPPYYYDDDDVWVDENPYFAPTHRATLSPSRVILPRTTTAPPKQMMLPSHGTGKATRRTQRPSPPHSRPNEERRSAIATPLRSAAPVDGSCTTASLSSSSSSKRQLLRPNILPSDASLRHGDATSLRTTSTSSGSGRLPARNARRSAAVPEEEEEASSYDDDDDEEEEEVAWDDAAFHASFVSIDFGSTAGVAPPIPPPPARWLSQPTRNNNNSTQPRYPPAAEDQWSHEEEDHDYGYGKDYFDDDDDDALLFPHHEDLRPPQLRDLERAVRRGSSLASGDPEAVAHSWSERPDGPRQRPWLRTTRSKRPLPGRGSHGAPMVPPPSTPPRRSSVRQASGAMMLRLERAAPMVPREMPRDRRRSSLQHSSAAAASYRAAREPPLARSRSYEDQEDFGLPRGYDVVAPPARRLARTLSQPDLFDWKDDVSFSDLAVRNR
jgi:hypothetical protein